MIEVQLYTSKTGEQNGCLIRTRSDKQIERKSYICIWTFLVFLSPGPALFESPCGDRIFSFCTGSRKGVPQAVKSIRFRYRDCGLIMQKGNRIAVEW